MAQMKVTTLLEKYKEWVDAGDIQFLQEPTQQKEVSKCINDLIPTMGDLEKENGGGKGKGQDWYKAHKEGRALWETLAKYALRDIEPTSKGNSTLYSFLSAATEFEDILYGLESFYRDHTLHSLWVYLIGEYILREKLKGTDIRKKLEWYLYNDISEDEDKISIPKVLVNYSRVKANILAKVVARYTDAIWCIMALCHDLGYSLEKLGKLNDKVKAVLEFFDISELKYTGYSLDIEHQYLVSQCLELMAMDVRIVPGEDYKRIKDDKHHILDSLNNTKDKKLEDEINDAIRRLDAGELEKLDIATIIRNAAGLTDENLDDPMKELEENTLIKCYRDDSTYWRLCRALEKKQHGILSSYLIYKILGIFADAAVRGPAEEWGLDDDEAVDNIIRGDILFAIAQHEFDFAHIFEFGSLADILVLSDELEEFSRLGRPLQSREYLPTAAFPSVDFNPKKKYIEINMTYDVEEKHNLISFFIRKAERLCSLYSLKVRDKPKSLYRVKRIKMTARKRVETNNGGPIVTLELIIEINKDRNSIARLPIHKSSGTVHNSDTKDYTVSLYDDKIRIIDKEIDKKSPEAKLLSEWFEKLGKLKEQRKGPSKEWQKEVENYIALRNQSKEKT